MFVFKDKNSNDMGVYVREESFLGKAPMKHDSIHIDGRSGEEIVELGYENFEGSLNDVVITKDNRDDVLNWLSGSGELEYLGKKTRIHFLDGYQIAKHKKTFSIPFIRDPFWYAIEESYSVPWGSNLINNGWDSFLPFGYEGEEIKAPLEVFNEGYSRNYVPDSGYIEVLKPRTLAVEDDYLAGKYITIMMTAVTNKVKHNTDRKRAGVEFNITMEDGKIHYIGAFKSYTKGDSVTSTTDTVATTIKIPEGKVKRVTSIAAHHQVEAENIKITDVKVEINDYEKHKVGNHDPVEWTPAWEDLPDKDKPVRAWDNMAVHITSLRNGLTRIQTCGGKQWIKIMYNEGYKRDTQLTWSTYVENIGEKHIKFRVNQGLNYLNIKPKTKDLLILKNDPTNSNYSQFQIGVDTLGDNLDFIASTPTIVEGDKHPTWEADSNPRIVNEGSVYSTPLIKLTKGSSDVVEYEVNGIYFKYTFKGEPHAIIDCDGMNAYYNGLLRNRQLEIGFAFPKLNVGDNVVKTVSGDAKIEFKRKDRWL